MHIKQKGANLHFIFWHSMYKYLKDNINIVQLFDAVIIVSQSKVEVYKKNANHHQEETQTSW